MASTYAKRLQKLEEQMAAKINKPLAYLWLEDGEDHAAACIRAGYDPSQADRIMFIRWMTAEEAKVAPKPHWDEPVAGPLPTEGQLAAPTLPQDGRSEAPRDDRRPKIAHDNFYEEAESRYRLAIEEREREIVNEKLYDAAKAFAKTIV